MKNKLVGFVVGVYMMIKLLFISNKDITNYFKGEWFIMLTNELVKNYGYLFSGLNELKESRFKNKKYFGNVYMFELGDKVKIGYSKNPKNRLVKIQRDFEFYSEEITGMIFISKSHTNYKENEKIIHKILEDKRIKREFFDVSLNDELISIFSKVKFLDETKEIQKKSKGFVEFMKSIFFKRQIKNLGDLEKDNLNDFLVSFFNDFNKKSKAKYYVDINNMEIKEAFKNTLCPVCDLGNIKQVSVNEDGGYLILDIGLDLPIRLTNKGVVM